ncbi:TRAP transporter substrate-binding protein DctP [Alcaligenaceae bacterium]|nr:TRAP transporter substrate-binding protein DctP [Alcaligenaceae bacterium]
MDKKNQQSRRSFLLATGGVAAGTLASVHAPAVMASGKQPKFRWKIQTHWPQGTWYYQAIFQKMADDVKAATDGELELETHHPGSVVGTGDVLRAVQRGTLDSAFTWPAYWVGQIPVAGHLNGNLGTWGSHEEMHFFMYDMGALDIIREAYAERGVYQLGPYSAAGLSVFSKKPVRTIEDFKGFNIRSTGTPAKVFEKLGAAPVSISGEELYQALQTGVVDGVHWGGVAAGWGMSFQEVTSYILRPNFLGHTNGEVIINMKKWNELGEDHKQVLDSVLRATSINSSAQFTYNDYLLMEKFTKDFNGEIVNMGGDVMEQVRKHSMDVVNEDAKKDEKYSGKVTTLLNEFMRLTGKA